MFMQHSNKKQLSSSTRKKSTTLTISGIFAIVMSLSILFQIGSLYSAHALSHYFNCIIRGANKSGALTQNNADYLDQSFVYHDFLTLDLILLTLVPCFGIWLTA